MKSIGKKNENESVLKMLDILHKKGVNITIDVLNKQKDCLKIIKNKSDYTICIKNNHKKLKEEIAVYSHKNHRENPSKIPSAQTLDKAHARIEKRTSD